MPFPKVVASAASAVELTERFAAIRAEFRVPEQFEPEVLAAADAAARDISASTATGRDDRTDRRDVPLRTLDPVGSRDLDQAFGLTRQGSGYLIRYAIADVAAWVDPGSPVDRAAHDRGVTVYCPDVRIPLHPLSLSEGRASLLPDQDVPAVLWEVAIDQAGRTTDVRVERATVRSRGALDYGTVQSAIDGGTADDELMLLEEVGKLRLAQEATRGGVSLTLPTQEVHRIGADSAPSADACTTEPTHFALSYERGVPAEAWNAQLSLCCGMAAAELMLSAGVGIVRTLPPAAPDTLAALEALSRALHVEWSEQTTYPEWVRSLDPSTPIGCALMVAAARTLRGASYAAFDGTAPPTQEHAAIASPYAHVTAPLRRLVDRYGAECAIAAHQGRRPPAWVLAALDELAPTMQSATQRASGVDRACVDVVETAVLSTRIGDTFDAAVMSVDREQRATVQLIEPAVITSVDGSGVRPGDTLRVRLDAVDLDARRATFTALAASPDASDHQRSAPGRSRSAPGR